MKMGKIIKIMIFVAMVFCILINTTNIFAADPEDPEEQVDSRIPTEPSGGVTNNGITETTKNIWATAANVVQVLAIAAIVFAGLRYMFASADSKADIKKQLIILVIGAVLVFASVEFAKMIQGAANTILT